MDSIRALFFSIILIGMFSATTFSQEQYNLRSVNIANGDSVIKTQASNIWPKKKKLVNAPYYWYNAGKIQMNFGGYSGKPIHGKYEVFDKNNHLLKQGMFVYGLMQGSWMEWYPDGLKKIIANYENGNLEGEHLLFAKDGKLLSKRCFQKGVLHGKSYFYYPDTVIVKKYKRGKEEIKKAKNTYNKSERKKLAKQTGKAKENKNENLKPAVNDKADAVNDSIISKPKKCIFNFRKSRKPNNIKDEKL